MEQEVSMKELVELHRQTLEVLRQALALLEKVVNPPMFRLTDTVTIPAQPVPYTPIPTPWAPVQPGIGTAPGYPWPNGTIICTNEGRAAMEANRGERV